MVVLREQTTAAAVAQAEAFKAWHSRTGHWVFEYRADAVRAWRKHGIVGRPDYCPQVDALLAPWVAADPLPALVAKWNAERAAS